MSDTNIFSSSIHNPVLQGFNPDPSIVRVGSDYYMVTSTFEYFPGVPVYHSKTLFEWELIGHVLTRPSQLMIQTPEPGSGIWAPTIRYHAGWFYMTTCSFNWYKPQSDDRVWPRGFYVKTQNIRDSTSWSDPIYFDQVGFDQDLFWDDHGTVYLSTTVRKDIRTERAKLKDFAIHICTVDLSTGNSTSPTRLIRESHAGMGVAEGSHIIKRQNYYYLFTAEGGTEAGHSEHVCRSDNGPFGPWEPGPNNLLLCNTIEDDVQNTGHADLVEDEQGRWWAVFLAVRPFQGDVKWQNSVLGRETFIVPVTWENDWPIFNNRNTITARPSSRPVDRRKGTVLWYDDFSKRDLQLGWYRKGTPVKPEFSLDERPKYLRLYGGPYDLSSPACPTLFLRKQIDIFVWFESVLEFDPEDASTEAGVVAYWNYLNYSKIAVTLSPTTGRRIVRHTVAGMNEVVERDIESHTQAPGKGGKVRLVIACGESYRFGFEEVSQDEPDPAERSLSDKIVWLGEVSNEAMTRRPPIGMQFTGMMIGLYANGRNRRCLNPADFKYAGFWTL